MKRMLFFVFFISVMQLSASTIIVNSVYDSEENPGSFAAAAAIEDGLMNSLFDYGFIMFSAVNETGYTVEGAKDARYMIRIEFLEADFSVSYQLLATVNGTIINSGFVDIADINGNSGLEERKLYYLLGEEVAAKLKQFF